jgi:hypothetical protein
MRILPEIHRPPQIKPKPAILRPQQKVVSLGEYRVLRARALRGDDPTPPGVAIALRTAA